MIKRFQEWWTKPGVNRRIDFKTGEMTFHREGMTGKQEIIQLILYCLAFFAFFWALVGENGHEWWMERVWPVLVVLLVLDKYVWNPKTT